MSSNDDRNPLNVKSRQKPGPVSGLTPLSDKQEAVLIVRRLTVGGSHKRMTLQLLKLNWHRANENPDHNAAVCWGTGNSAIKVSELKEQSKLLSNQYRMTSVLKWKMWQCELLAKNFFCFSHLNWSKSANFTKSWPKLPKMAKYWCTHPFPPKKKCLWNDSEKKCTIDLVCSVTVFTLKVEF